MLEIPSLAIAVAALAVLANWRPKNAFPEILAGALFGAAILIKLISLVWTPLAALLVGHRLLAPGKGKLGVFSGLATAIKSPAFVLRLAIFAGALLCAAFAIDLLVEQGAYWINFQQSWQSHFSAPVTSAYGSAAEHPFDWTIFLRHWDTALPAVIGTVFALSQARASVSFVFPVVWLLWSLLVFGIHRPWWPYYYIHTAIPLCWLAAVGLWRLKENLQGRMRKGSGRQGKRKQTIPLILLGTCAVCAAAWMLGRVYLEIMGMRALPRTFSSLVIPETQRYRPYAHWLYADDLTLSYHADIPMLPTLAVVPLKRFWSGGMTADVIAEEFARYRPELAILNNANTAVPFRTLLNSDYRLVYQDDRYQLFAITNIITQAQSGQ